MSNSEQVALLKMLKEQAKTMFGNTTHCIDVELALTREVARLRALAEKINPLVDAEGDV